MLLVPAVGRAVAAPRSDGELAIEVVDAETGKPIAARMHLKNSRGRPVRLRVDGLNQFADHFYIDGKLTLRAAGRAVHVRSRSGPEYRTQNGHFEIERHADDTERIEMHRFADLAKEGWCGGRSRRRAPRGRLAAGDAGGVARLRAEPGRHGRERAGGGAVGVRTREAARRRRQDVARGLARGEAARRARRSRGRRLRGTCRCGSPAASSTRSSSFTIMRCATRWSTTRTTAGRATRRSFPAATATAAGRRRSTITCSTAGCGFRRRPAAARARTTVRSARIACTSIAATSFRPSAWWEGLEAGQVFVTNGPLLRPMVEGQPPGYVFHLTSGGPLELEIGLNLATRVPVEYLQIIKNGSGRARSAARQVCRSGRQAAAGGVR